MGLPILTSQLHGRMICEVAMAVVSGQSGFLDTFMRIGSFAVVLLVLISSCALTHPSYGAATLTSSNLIEAGPPWSYPSQQHIHLSYQTSL